MAEQSDKPRKPTAKKATKATKTTKTTAKKSGSTAASSARAAQPAPATATRTRSASTASARTPVNPLVNSVTACLVVRDGASTIAATVEGVEKALADAGTDFEIIVVNDGSTDATEVVLNELQAERTTLRVTTNRAPRGYGAALRAALEGVTRDWVFMMVADGRADIGALGMLIDVARDDVDVVQGYALGRHVGRAAVALVAGVEAAAVGCEFRLARRDVLDGLALRADTEAIGIELARALERRGARTVYVGVSVESPAAPADLGVRAQRVWSVARDLGRVTRSARTPR